MNMPVFAEWLKVQHNATHTHNKSTVKRASTNALSKHDRSLALAASIYVSGKLLIVIVFRIGIGKNEARLGIEPRIFGLRDRRLTTWPPSQCRSFRAS